MQLFPKMNFHTLFWMSLIWSGLGATTVATYQMRLRISVLQTSTLPAKVRDFLNPSSAMSWFKPSIFLSHVASLLCALRGKEKPSVAGGSLVGVSVKGVFCKGVELERGVSADFLQFTIAPETSEYNWRRVISLRTFLSSLMKNVESSAKAVLVRVPLGVSTPSISTLAAAKSGSNARTKSRGAIGSPWGTPCLHCRTSS